MDFSKLLPGIKPWVESLPHTWPFSVVQGIDGPFGAGMFGAFHVAGLALLGGCVILTNIRLAGAGLVDEKPSVVERNLRPWLITGVCIVIGTGLVIGAVNSSKLYSSTAFFAKMVALLASLIFSFGVVNSVARSEGEVSTLAKVLAATAALVWLYALDIFGTTVGLNPGALHMIEAGYAILAIFGRRTRWIGVAAIGLLLVGDYLMYFIVGLDSQDQIYLDISKYATEAAALLLVGLLGFEVFTGKAEPASPLARIIAVFSILTWVTVAAAGRWIGMS